MGDAKVETKIDVSKLRFAGFKRDYGVILEMTNKLDGRYVILDQRYIDRPILNPELLTGKPFWFTREGGYNYCHPEYNAKATAHLMAASPRLLDYLLKSAAHFENSDEPLPADLKEEGLSLIQELAASGALVVYG